MTEPTRDPQSALERPLKVTEVPPEGLDIGIVASDAERDALARLNALVAVPVLEAKLRVRRWRGDGLAVEGELRAIVRQVCVLTVEEFDAEILTPVEVRFAPERPPATARRARGARRDDAGDEAALTVRLDDDPPDPLVGGGIDLGAVVSEFLTLALDPYPRKPGAQFVEPAPADATAEASPFVLLRKDAPKPSEP
jgi:hypothetical protein